ncbi:MAG: TIGR03032 family protein [Proteobacteria bacterium]|nr:TIGR03032 family protein [Pseudomonadota bacterium]
MSEGTPQEPADTPQPVLEITASRQLPSWLAEAGVSLAFTTYQAGKLVFAGLGPDGRLSIFERTFNRCMGLCGDGQSLYMSSLYQLWRFENALRPGQDHAGYDRLYIPVLGLTTGDLDIHDLAVDGKGRVVFVNTLFSCLAVAREGYSFAPLWQPPFISRLAAEDRCHLNGLAMADGRPAFVTAASRTDVADGWREHRREGGCVIDVASGEVVAAGLSMPHSPRLHRGRLWLLESGSGQLGTVDLEGGRFEPLAFCPGYVRGLAFAGDFAVVGLSKQRQNRTFHDLPLEENLTKRNAVPRCGVAVIDLRTGDLVHWLWLEGVMQELYDVIALPGVRRPMALGFRTDEIRRTLRIAAPEAL